MTYNVFSGSLNPTQSINGPGQRAVKRLLSLLLSLYFVIFL